MINIGIVGAGIMGRMLGLALNEQGYVVTLFEKQAISHPKNCSYVAAGMLSPYAELHCAQPSLIAVFEAAINLWPKYIKKLNEKIFYDVTGTLCVAHSENRAELEFYQQTLKQKKLINKCKNVAIDQYEPEIDTQYKTAIYLPEAQIDAQSVMYYLQKYFIRKKIDLISNAPIDEIEKFRHNFDWLIDCRGLGAKQEFNDLRGIRGELVHLFAPRVNLRHVVRIINARCPIYILPRKNHKYIVGATSIESDNMAPISVRSTLELLSHIYSIHKGFAEAHLLQTKVHCRPTLLDNLPKIKINQKQKIIKINGLYRHGFSYAPVFAEAITQLIETQKINFLAQPFCQYEEDCENIN